MNKEEFLRALEARLGALPENERAKSLSFYAEMLDDMTEDGLSEEEAVKKLGPVEKIAEEVLLDAPLTTLVLARAKPKHTMRAWEIVLLVLGSVVWVPLLVSFFIVVLSVYLCIWAVIVSLFAAVFAVAVCAPAALAIPISLHISLGFADVLVLIGGVLVLAGLAVVLFIGVWKLTKLLIRLSAFFIRSVKSLFIRKETES